jgi:hypothetical protein
MGMEDAHGAQLTHLKVPVADELSDRVQIGKSGA